MLIVISPAKRLDWSPTGHVSTEPAFQREASILAGHARQLSLRELRDLMDLSEDLARLNRDRFRTFSAQPDPDAVKPAVLAFAGDTYIGLEARSLSEDDLAWAQDHLRILSGIYGVLRPLDAIQPYRLEMGSRLKTRRGKSLYDFWGDTISRALNAAAETAGAETLINCASQEYFGAVDRAKLAMRVVTPVFLEDRGGQAKTVSFFAKKARGSMARFIIEHRIADPEGILDFSTGGYRYDPARSSPDAPVFVRDYPEDGH